MDAKKIIGIVQDMGPWKGDMYNLAYTIAAMQKEADAKIAEDNGQIEIAELIRGS